MSRATPNDYDTFSWIDVLFCEVHIESSFSSWIDELFLVNCMWSRPFFPDLRTFLARCISSPLFFSPLIDRCLLLTCMKSFFHGSTNFFSVYFGVLRNISSRLFLRSTNFSSGVLGM